MKLFKYLKNKFLESINTEYKSSFDTSESSDEISTIKEKPSNEIISNKDNHMINLMANKKIKDKFFIPNKPKPLTCELTVPELKILHYRSNIFKKNDSLPIYLSVYSEVLNKLINDGYFTEPKPIIYLQNKLKVQDLKNYLKINNLPVSGKKDILVQRIIENIPNDKISENFNLDQYYALSPKGIKIINKYPKQSLDTMEF